MRPYNRQAITLYVRWQNPISGLVKPFKRILTNCYYTEQSGVIADRTGIVLKNATFIQVFNQPDLKYIQLHEWQSLSESELNGKWTIELGATASFIVPYIVDHDFHFANISQVTQLENIFINNTNDARRIADKNDNRKYFRNGKETMASHIELRV